MIRIVAIALLVAGLLVTTRAIAGTLCVTPYGSCPLGGGAQNGATCYCSSPNGSIGGRAQVDGGPLPGPAPLPSICCTPAGRIPFANNSIPVGGTCTVPTIRGSVSGQACY